MTEQTAIRVLIVDDHDMLRQGLAVFLRSFEDLVLAGEASNGQEALLACQQAQPDVILMDIMMPGRDGIASARAILQEYPDIRIIALTSADDREHISAALQAGMSGYVLKNMSSDDLANAIRAVHRGRRILSPEVTDVLVDMVTHVPVSPLSERELDVLRLMVQGKNNPDIAAELLISRSTVKTHVSSILAKLGVTSRLEAVRVALEDRLVG